MPSSSVTKQTEEVLDEVLRTIRQEHENFHPVLCETDRSKFVEEEESLREQLKDTLTTNSSSWRGLLCLPSPQAVRCLKNAEELRQRVKEDINSKLRTRLSGKSNPPASPSWRGENSGTSAPEIDGPLAEGNHGPASTIITSPLNMRCSLPPPEDLEVSNVPVVPRDDGSSPSDTSSESSDRSGDSSGRRRRRSPPPPPPQRVTLSRRPAPPPPQSPRQSMTFRSPANTPSPPYTPLLPNPAIVLSPPPPRRRAPLSSPSSSTHTSSNTSSDTPRRSSSVRRPAPPPPQSPRQSGSPRSSINASFSSSGPLPPDPRMISSISKLAQHVNTLASSIVTESLSRPGQGQQRLRHGAYVTKTNCLEINGSDVDGVTLNNGGSNNSGAVIHKTIAPPRLPQHISPI